ncbi:MAG: LysM peptidoglycan-binding domain-containing protein [Planctomycetaceae bacterium]
MAGNTKLGMILILLIVTAFGVVVYKKVERHKFEVANGIDHSNDAPEPEDDTSTFGKGDQQPFEKDDRAHKHAGHNHGKSGQLDTSNPAPPPKEFTKPKVVPASEEFPVAGNIRGHGQPAAPAPKPAADKKAFSDDDLGLDEPFEKDNAHSQSGDKLAGEPQLKRTPLAPAPKPEVQRPHAHDKDEFGKGDSFEADDAHAGHEKDEFEDPFGGEGDKVVTSKQKPAPAPHGKDEFGELGDEFDAKPAPVPHGKDVDVFAADDAEKDPDMFDDSAPAPKVARKSHVPSDNEEFRKHKAEGFIEGSEDMFGKPGPRPKKPRELPEPEELPEPVENVHVEPPQPIENPEPPAPHPGRPGHIEHETYVVQVGDNFWNISRKKYGTARFFRALALMNRDEVPNADELQPGTRIVAPSKQFFEVHAAEIVENAEIQLVSGYFQDDSGRRLYRVGPHDTLPQIASRHLGRNSRWIQIYEMNRDKLSSPDDLHAGVNLELPADARRGFVVHAVDEDR